MKAKLYSIVTLLVLFLSLLGLKQVSAAEVTDYTTTAKVFVDGVEMTQDTVVQKGQAITIDNTIVFPDSQVIQEGDTLTLELPSILKWRTPTTFDLYNEEGVKIASAETNVEDKTVLVTFTDEFSINPLNKVLYITFNTAVDTEVITKSGPASFDYSDITYGFVYDAGEVASIGDYEFKYGYQDKEDPSLVRWKIIINAVQDTIKAPVITDTFGEGYVLEGPVRAVRYARIESVDKVTESILPNYSPVDRYTVIPNATNTGFEILDMKNRGIWLDGVLYIEYTTRLTDSVSTGDTITNTITWSADNFDQRSAERYVTLELAYGSGDSDPEPSSSSTEPSTSSSSSTEPSTSSSSSTEPSTSASSSTEPSTSSSSSTEPSVAPSSSQPTPPAPKDKVSVKPNQLPSTGEKQETATIVVLAVVVFGLLTYVITSKKKES